MVKKETNGGVIISRENRIMINAIKEDIKDIKISILDLANHYSQRLPLWAVAIITFLTSLAVGSIIYGAVR